MGLARDNITSIRLATQTNNAHNHTLNSNNTSGYKGVYYVKTCHQYMARIKINGRNIYLGIFHTKESAALAYLNAAIKYHGEFAKAQQSPRKDLF